MITETKHVRSLLSILLIFIFASFIAQTDVFAAKGDASLDAQDLPVGGWTPAEEYELEEDVDVVNPSESQSSKRNLLKASGESVFDKGVSTIGYNALKTDAQQTFYNNIDTEAKAFMASSTVIQSEIWGSNNEKVYCVADLDYRSLGLTKNQAWQAFQAYDYDHPAYYWIKSSGTMWSSPTYIYLTTFEEYADPNERAPINELVTEGVEEYVSLAEKGEDTLDKISIVHDKMVSEIDYAYNSSNKPETAKWAHSVHGVFDPAHYSVVCEGYADTFSLIMNYMGIANYYIVGTAYTGSSSGGHAWNAVSDDGGKSYMYMDLTWDDDGEAKGYDYLYFGMPKSDFEYHKTSGSSSKEIGHKADTPSGTDFDWLYDLPENISDSLEGSYYYKGDFYYDGSGTTTASDFAKKIKTKAARAGDCVSVLSSNETNCWAINSELGISSYYTGSYNNSTYYYGLKKISESEIDISSAEVNPDKTEYTYTGSAIRPEAEVTVNGVKLLKGKNYSVSYVNNTNPGTATVTVTGEGNFSGSASAEFTISGDPEAGDDEPAVLAFTSDVHNDQKNYYGETRLGTWIDNIRSQYGKIDVMAFGGDMAQYNSADTRFWSETQRVMDLVAAKGVTAYYTTGNHEYDHDSSITDDFYPDKNETTRKYIQNDWAVEDGSNYRIYCMGVGEASDYTYVNNAYTANQVTTLREKLAAVDNSKPIFIITHFPLHYNGSRTISKASDVIDTLNNAANNGTPNDSTDDRKIIFLWGHNHSMSNPNDAHYDTIYQKGSNIEYESGHSKDIKFIYAAAGCMSDTEKDAGSGKVEGKGLVATVNSKNQITLAYHKEDGSVVTENGGPYEEKDPVAVTGVTIDEKPAEGEEGLSVEVRRTLQLHASIEPSDATEKTVTWDSSDYSIATVSSSGEVKGVSTGTAVITARVADSVSGEDYTADVEVTVVPYSGPVYVLTNQLKAGRKYIIANKNTGNAYALKNNNGSVSTEAVTIDGNSLYPESEGIVFTAQGSGDSVTNISNGGRYLSTASNSLSLSSTATSNRTWSYDGSKLICKSGSSTYYLYYTTYSNNYSSSTSGTSSSSPREVYLFEEYVPVNSVSLNKTEADLEPGESVQLTATVLPENATKKDVTWSSSDTNVATVDANGLVTAAGPGTATITAVSKDNEQKYAECTITVVATVSYDVTFQVKNGKWNDGTNANKTVTLSGREGTALKLAQDQIPAVGNNPTEGFKAGSWDTEPSTTTVIDENKTYTYTYVSKIPWEITKIPTAKTLTYNGGQQELITSGEVSEGTMYYAVTQSSSIPTTGWSTSVPKGTNAGSYNVYYKVPGDADHLDIDPVKVDGVSISKAALTIKADDKGKKYGENDPTLTYTVTGLQGSDKVTGSLKRDTGENVGTYDIKQGTLTAGSNYDISFTGATFTISKASMTVSASGYNGPKDSRNHSITVTLTPTPAQTSDVTIYYSDTTELTGSNYESAGTTTKPSWRDAGKVTVYYYVVSGNYDPTPAGGSATVNIYDKTALNSAVSTAESYYNSIKTGYATIAAELKTELDKAKAIMNKTDAEQSEIDDEVTSLNTALATAKAAQLEADKTAFSNYKDEQKAVVQAMAEDGDSAASTALITGALSDINALQYNTSKTLAQNKAAVDTIVSELSSALETQRAADAQEAEDTAAAASVAELIGALPDSITLDDKEAIEAARAAYEALSTDQKDLVSSDALQKLQAAEAALQAAEEAAEEAARVAEFNSYKSNKITVVESMAAEGDSADSTALIESAKSDIDALQYDSNKSLAQNKAAVDSIVSSLEAALTAQRADDAQEAEDTAAAASVTDIIEGLPAVDSIKPDDRAAIEAARSAYENLTDDQKEKVSEATKQALIDAETALQAAEDAAVAAAEEARKAEEEARKAEEAQRTAAELAEWNGVLNTSIPAAKSVKAKAAKKKVTVSWKKLDKAKLKKYSKTEIQVCPDKGFARANTIRKVVGKKKSSAKIGGLAGKTTYYVRVRNVQGSGAGKTVSKWSKPKKIKIK